MKKIVFFSGGIDRSGGTERVLSLIASGLANKDYEVVIVSMCGEKKSHCKRRRREIFGTEKAGFPSGTERRRRIMPIDLNRSRRRCYERCQWWSRDNHSEDNSELIIKKNPDGIFYAMENSPVTRDNNIVGGNFMMDRVMVSIFSPDDCSKLKQNDIVLYEGELWMVVDCQVTKFRKSNSEFANNNATSHNYFIRLRRA